MNTTHNYTSVFDDFPQVFKQNLANSSKVKVHLEHHPIDDWLPLFYLELPIHAESTGDLSITYALSTNPNNPTNQRFLGSSSILSNHSLISTRSLLQRIGPSPYPLRCLYLALEPESSPPPLEGQIYIIAFESLLLRHSFDDCRKIASDVFGRLFNVLFNVSSDLSVPPALKGLRFDVEHLGVGSRAGKPIFKIYPLIRYAQLLEKDFDFLYDFHTPQQRKALRHFFAANPEHQCNLALDIVDNELVRIGFELRAFYRGKPQTFPLQNLPELLSLSANPQTYSILESITDRFQNFCLKSDDHLLEIYHLKLSTSREGKLIPKLYLSIERNPGLEFLEKTRTPFGVKD